MALDVRPLRRYTRPNSAKNIETLQFKPHRGRNIELEELARHSAYIPFEWSFVNQTMPRHVQTHYAIQRDMTAAQQWWALRLFCKSKTLIVANSPSKELTLYSCNHFAQSRVVFECIFPCTAANRQPWCLWLHYAVIDSTKRCACRTFAYQPAVTMLQYLFKRV